RGMCHVPGSVPRRSGTFHQPEAATTTATSSGSQGGGQEQKRTLLPPRSSLLPPPSSLFPPPSSLLPPPYHTAHHHLPDPPLPLSLPLRNDQGTAWSKQCDGQLSSQSGSKEQQAPSPPPPLHSTPLSFPMPLLPPPPHLLPSHPPPPPLPHPYPGQEEHGGKDCVTAMLNPLAPPCALVVRPPPPHLLVILTLTLTLGDCHPHPHPHPWWHHLPDPPLPRRCNQEEQPRGAARSGSQEQQLGAAARSGSQEAWARQVVGQGQEAHAPHSQEAQPGGRGSSQQGGSKESAMAHGDNSEWPAPCTSVAPIAQPYREHAPCCLQV
ncbi:hypothetical protein QJQ45_029571, partial [Haematococcus lacustris]